MDSKWILTFLILISLNAKVDGKGATGALGLSRSLGSFGRSFGNSGGSGRSSFGGNPYAVRSYDPYPYIPSGGALCPQKDEKGNCKQTSLNFKGHEEHSRRTTKTRAYTHGFRGTVFDPDSATWLYCIPSFHLLFTSRVFHRSLL